MSDIDYYTLLGVEPGASPAEIKRAYRRLVFRHHPDRNPDNKDAVNQFKQILEAYEVLSDHEKRAQYDEATQSTFKNRPRGDEYFGKGFRYSYDFKTDIGLEPRCPECSVVGVEHIVTKKGGARVSRGKQFINAPFLIMFCAKCGHVYGVTGAQT